MGLFQKGKYHILHIKCMTILLSPIEILILVIIFQWWDSTLREHAQWYVYFTAQHWTPQYGGPPVEHAITMTS